MINKFISIYKKKKGKEKKEKKRMKFTVIEKLICRTASSNEMPWLGKCLVFLLNSYQIHSVVTYLGLEWFRLVPNRTNSGLFTIRFQYWNRIRKSPEFVHLGPNLNHFGPNIIKIPDWIRLTNQMYSTIAKTWPHNRSKLII